MALLFLATGGYFFYIAVQDQTGLDFMLHMVIALVLLAPLPVILYRLYALVSSVYTLRRDGLRIRWGCAEKMYLSMISNGSDRRMSWGSGYRCRGCAGLGH